MSAWLCKHHRGMFAVCWTRPCRGRFFMCDKCYAEHVDEVHPKELDVDDDFVPPLRANDLP
jgi:hypothetical protein